MENFKVHQLPNAVITKIVGGTGSDDKPITTLGTITNEGDG